MCRPLTPRRHRADVHATSEYDFFKRNVRPGRTGAGRRAQRMHCIQTARDIPYSHRPIIPDVTSSGAESSGRIRHSGHQPIPGTPAQRASERTRRSLPAASAAAERWSCPAPGGAGLFVRRRLRGWKEWSGSASARMNPQQQHLTSRVAASCSWMDGWMDGWKGNVEEGRANA